MHRPAAVKCEARNSQEPFWQQKIHVTQTDDVNTNALALMVVDG